MDKYLEANAEFSKFSRNYMELKKGLPIRPSEMGVLNIITETPGPHTSVMLTELLGVSKPMIAAHLSVLTKKDISPNSSHRMIRGFITYSRQKKHLHW